MEIILFIAVIIGLYLIINGKRNSDPLNRKCAAEICELVTSTDDCTPEEIVEIFRNNARYRKQASHVVSMVPPLLMKAGHPQNIAMGIVPLLREAQTLMPK